MKLKENQESFIPVWPALPWLQIFKRSKKSQTFPFFGPRQHYFYFGRAALWHACDFLGLKRGDEVIVPAYSNDLIFEVFASRGIKTRYIDINLNFQINIELLKKTINSRTRAVLVIHFFGWPQENLNEIVKLCHEKGIFLIEDCALAPASFFAGRPLGSFGDVSIFSLKKYFPVPNGGLLAVNNQELLEKNESIETIIVNSWFELASSFLAQLFLVSSLSYKILGYFIAGVKKTFTKYQKVRTGSAEFTPKQTRLGASKITPRLLKSFDLVAIRKKRRLNFERLDHLVKKIEETATSTRPFKLKFGISPLVYPLMVDGASQNYAQVFRRQGIGAGAWWHDQGKYQRLGEFPNSEFLRNKIVILPIHQSLNYKKIDFVGEVVQRSLRDNKLKLIKNSLTLPHAAVESSGIK